MSISTSKRRLKELADEAGIVQVRQEPLLCRPAAKGTPSPATEADHIKAIALLAELRKNKPGYKDARDGVKGIFRTKTKIEKRNNPENWQWSCEELDEGLAAVIDGVVDTGEDLNFWADSIQSTS